MRILFIGSVIFSEKALETLLRIKANVVGVITKKKSTFNADFVDLSYIAVKNNIPCLYADEVSMEEMIDFIKSCKPDVIYCFGWSHLIPKEILDIPKLGVIGFHPAKLPQNRGRHPIIWSLFLGLEETASTFFFMDEGIDSGDILSQEIIKIEYEDDAWTLYQKIINVGLKQIENFTHQLGEASLGVGEASLGVGEASLGVSNFTFQRIKQDHSKANYWRKRGRMDGIIDFRMSSRAVYNLVRALTKPYIGAEVLYKGKLYKVWKAKEEYVNLPNIEPGKVIDIENNNILVKCYANAIWLIEHEITEEIKRGDYLL